MPIIPGPPVPNDFEVVLDSSEVTGPWRAEAPDIVIVGGYGIDREKKASFYEEVANVKRSYGLDPDCPVKWNMKDLKKSLAAGDFKECLPKLLEYSDSLRLELLNVLVTLKAYCFLSVIRAHSTRRKVLSATQQDLAAFSFGNLLMRIGKFRRSSLKIRTCEVVLDWPARSDRSPFVNEYRQAWRQGKSTGRTVTYHCGALRDIGFYPSPVFSVMELDPRLQVADLVVGATRCFVDFALGKTTDDNFGVQCLSLLKPRIWQSSGRMIGNGLTVSPTRSDFSDALASGLVKLR